MKNVTLKALLLGGLFLFSYQNAHTQTLVTKDKMVFKVGTRVFSLNDLRTYFQMVQNLACIYDDSLLVKLFEREFSASEAKNFKFRSNFSTAQKEYFLKLISFAKLFVYSTSQNVVVDPNVKKFFALSAKQNKCDLKVFQNPEKLQEEFREIMRMEVFVRSRFLPSEKNGKTTSEDFKKAINTAKNLMSSIGRQIDDEVYW